tara:strand:+ start:166 stop:357 length:192 start_codon:yes stop_codon:yes gene_type:complete
LNENNNRYVTKSLIGRGSYSKVYECQDILNTENKLIIKKFRNQAIGTGKEKEILLKIKEKGWN